MLVGGKRRTSVMTSLESKSLSKEVLDQLLEIGVDGIHVVTQKGSLDKSLSFLDAMLSASHKKASKTPLLLDMCNYPRARVSNLESEREFASGETVSFSLAKKGGDLELDTDQWDQLFAVDHSVYLGSGMVVLKVKSIEADLVIAEVVQGGKLFPEADVHVPYTRRSSSIETMPEEAWKLCAHKATDFVVIPALVSVEDLKVLKERIEAFEHAPWILLKIESKEGCEGLEDLLPYVRGVVVSRMELGMSIDPAQVPMITKEVIQKCNEHACMTLISSEMLASMRYNATPTRAEVSDIANVVFDGADGLILSEALAEGEYLARGYDLAHRAVEDAEKAAKDFPLNWVKRNPKIKDEIEAVTYAAYRAAHRNQAKAIVCLTKAGNTAFHIRSFESNSTIIAVFTSPYLERRLSIVKGVIGFKLESLPSIDDILPLINNLLLNETPMQVGDHYVFTSITLSSIGQEESNLFTVQTLSASQ